MKLTELKDLAFNAAIEASGGERAAESTVDVMMSRSRVMSWRVLSISTIRVSSSHSTKARGPVGSSHNCKFSASAEILDKQGIVNHTTWTGP